MHLCRLAATQPSAKGLTVPCPDSGPIDYEAPQEDQKALAVDWKQFRLRVLSCHPSVAFRCLNRAPLVAALPIFGRGSLTSGCVRPTTQKAADSEFRLSFWDFCFLFFPLMVRFPHITATGTVFALKGTESCTMLVEECGGGDLVWRNWLHQGKIRS